MAKRLPVYEIHDFKGKGEAFYVNRLKPHVKDHAFTDLPHKHDFFLVMLVTKGSGWHEIDFVKYKVKPGSVFFMQPGQMHYWKLSDDINGYVFFHSRAFYEEGFTEAHINDLPFFRSDQSVPFLSISSVKTKKLKPWLEELLDEYKTGGVHTHQKLRALLDLIYIELSRETQASAKAENKTYLNKLHRFERLIDQSFKESKYAGFYAEKLNITEKHLNRITQECVGKTSTQLIAERIVLEAKRLLMQGNMNVSETANELGYDDPSYFVRFFKKQTDLTPRAFLHKYKEENR